MEKYQFSYDYCQSIILSSNSLQMDETFWGVGSAAVEQSRCKANMVAQGDGKFGHWGWPQNPSEPKKKAPARNFYSNWTKRLDGHIPQFCKKIMSGELQPLGLHDIRDEQHWLRPTDRHCATDVFRDFFCQCCLNSIPLCPEQLLSQRAKSVIRTTDRPTPTRKAFPFN